MKMTKTELIQQIMILRVVYPNWISHYNKQEIQLHIDAWYQVFKDVDYEIFKIAIMETVKTCSGFVTPAHVIDELIKDSGGEEAFEKVRAFIRLGQDAYNDHKHELGEYILQIVADTGGWSRYYAMDDYNRVDIKKSFITQYKKLNKKVIMSGGKGMYIETNNVKNLEGEQNA